MPGVRSASAWSAGRALEVVAARYLDVLSGDPAALFGVKCGDHRADVIGFADPAERGLRGESRDGLREPGERVVADPGAGRPRQDHIDTKTPKTKNQNQKPKQHEQTTQQRRIGR